MKYMNWKYFIGKVLHMVETRVSRINSDFVRKHYPYGRSWMFDVKRALKNSPSLIIDAGANIGSVSLELNCWFPDAKIYAFEPVMATYECLCRQTAGKKSIHPLRLALGCKNEHVEILLNDENTINSLKVTRIDGDMARKEVIPVVRLDDFLRKHSEPSIGILKIDVEGFEFEVLNGCGTFLGAGINCIYLEVGYEREATKVHFSDVEQYLERHGYLLCGVYETRRNLFDKRRLWYSNNLYIHKDLLM